MEKCLLSGHVLYQLMLQTLFVLIWDNELMPGDDLLLILLSQQLSSTDKSRQTNMKARRQVFHSLSDRLIKVEASSVYHRQSSLLVQSNHIIALFSGAKKKRLGVYPFRLWVDELAWSTATWQILGIFSRNPAVACICLCMCVFVQSWVSYSEVQNHRVKIEYVARVHGGW